MGNLFSTYRSHFILTCTLANYLMQMPFLKILRVICDHFLLELPSHKQHIFQSIEKNEIAWQKELTTSIPLLPDILSTFSSLIGCF